MREKSIQFLVLHIVVLPNHFFNRAISKNPSPNFGWGIFLFITLSVGEVFMDVVHEYPDLTVHLTLFNVTIFEGVPQKLEHNDIRWITPAEIPNYDFCPADREILKRITELRG